MLKIGLQTVFALALLCSGYFAYQQATAYENWQHTLAAKHNANNQAENWLKSAGEMLSLGLYSGHSRQQVEIQLIEQQIQSAKKWTWVSGSAFLMLSILNIVLAFFSFPRHHLVAVCIAIALLALFIGIFAPMLSISAHKTLPVLGDVTLSFQSKSIASTIGGLFSKNNYLVGFAILGFSIILPLIKSLLMLLALPQFNKTSDSILHLLHSVGRWSMADVLVVAVLLVFFSMDQSAQADIVTQSDLQIGLYFFFYYVVLSLLAGQFLPTEKIRD